MEAILKKISKLTNPHKQEAWAEVAAILVQLNQYIAAHWSKLNTTRLETSELLSLTVELLPNNIDLLIEARKKLKQINPSSDIKGFAIVNLHGAINHKIEYLKTNDIAMIDKTPSITNLLQKIEIEKEIQFQETFFKLKSACENYKQYVLNLLKTKFKAKNELDFMYYFGSHDQSLDDIAEDITQDSMDKAFPKYQELNEFLEKEQELKMLLEKYLVIKDMMYTLQRQNATSQHKQAEFIAKLHQHKNLLRKNETSSWFAFSLWQSYNEKFFTTLHEQSDPKLKETSGLPFMRR